MSIDAAVMEFVMLAPAIWRGRQIDLVEGAHKLASNGTRLCLDVLGGQRFDSGRSTAVKRNQKPDLGDGHFRSSRRSRRGAPTTS